MSGSVANDENAIAVTPPAKPRPSPTGAPIRRFLTPVSAAGALLCVCVAGFVTLALLFSRHPTATSLDYRLITDVAADRAGWLTPLARTVTTLGTEIVLYPLLAAAGCLYWWKSGRALPGIAVLVWLWAGQLVRLSLSQQIARARPPLALRLVGASGLSFPSGHTTSATIGFGLLGALLLRLTRARHWRRAVIVSATLIVAAAVGCSRVYLGVHWPSDVLGGWLLGLAWLALGGLVLALIRLPRRTRGAAPLSDEAANPATS
jgi:membrane-associated phospholipid phosphatase